MRDLPLVLQLETTVSATKIVQPHGQPAHPAVIAQGLRKGQGLAHLALIAQATRAIMPLHHTRVDVRIAQQGQDVLAPRFAIEGTDFDPLDPPPLIVFFHLTIGQALRPA